jgi:geranylgeranyl diphosphate synthase type I
MFTKFKKDIDKGLADLAGTLKTGLKDRILYKGIKDFILRDGKRIRPILFLISYKGYTKRKRVPPQKLIRCALSMELLHDFLLIHDDVIDNSATRRGKPTLHRLFNTELAKPSGDKLGADLSIVAGDVIFALAMDALFAIDEPGMRKEKALIKFTEAARETGVGEFMDVINNIKDIKKIKKNDVFLTYTLKTAKYTFEAPLVIGAILSGAGKSEQQKLSRLGIVLGQAFQIYDDLLDVFSTSKKIGKPVLSDLNESKKTLLAWKTYSSLKGKDKNELEKILKKKKKTYGDLLGFRKLIKTAGADRYCVDKTLALLLEAGTICSTLKIRESSKKVLRQLIRDFYSKTVTFS